MRIRWMSADGWSHSIPRAASRGRDSELAHDGVLVQCDLFDECVRALGCTTDACNMLGEHGDGSSIALAPALRAIIESSCLQPDGQSEVQLPAIR